jgi:hypothetical protein
MKRIYHAIALLALIGFSGFARAQTPDSNNPEGDAMLVYCTPGASFNVQYISSVKVGSIYNITGWSSGGYGDYTSHWTAMAVGTGYPITVTNGFGYTSDQCAIWVDWNKDTDFTDAGEQITVSGTPGIGPYTANITVPSGTTTGTTRMRVRIAGQGSFNSCGTTMYGETEDYTVSINGTAPTTDVGVIDLLSPVTGTNVGANETVKIRVYNFGTVAQSNFPVSYNVGAGSTVTETVTASVAPGTSYDYTFSQKVNLNTLGATYVINTWTSLTGDQNSANDGISRNIFHAWAQNQKVVQGEYFINTDPGEGNGTAISGTYNLVDVTVNITNLNLPVGSTVYVRFKSQNGKWSFPRSFKRKSYLPNLNGSLAFAEYFVNTDPGQGNGTSTAYTGGNINISNVTVPVGSTVYVRVRDNFGRWSIPRGFKRTSFFPNTNSTVNYAEYFTGTDPGQGNGTVVTITAGNITVTNLGLPVGNAVYLRVRDNMNRWSLPMGITRQASFPLKGATLSYAEYFINTDPGKGNATPVTFSDENINIPTLNIQPGNTVYLRVKDSYQRWSEPRGYKRLEYYTRQGGKLARAEYFIDTDPGLGNGISIPFDTLGNMQILNLDLDTGHAVYLRVSDSLNRWSTPRGYSRPAMMPTRGSVLAGGEYFINNDPGKGNGTPLTFASGVATITGLLLHRNDILYVRAKDTYNRWGPPRALRYQFKDFQKAEYKIKLASNGTTTLPQLMDLLPPPDNTCGWIGKKDTVTWHANDTIWTRFQDQDGFYTNWKRGVVANAGTDVTICEGGTATLTATGGGSYHWSTGQAGPSIQVFPVVTTKYWVRVTDGAGAFSTDTVLVVVNPLPYLPGTISGLSEVCAGLTTTVYTVPQVLFASTYQWTLPPGATGASSTNSIQVTFGPNASSGIISVKGINACGQGNPSNFAILVRTTVPGPAGIISGNANPCKGDQVTYSITPISNATYYLWTLPSGASGASNTNSITVTFGASAVNGSISVIPVNSCGNGPSAMKLITIGYPPAAPTLITGPTDVCAGITVATYSVDPLPTASVYQWSLPQGAVGASTTNSILVTYGSLAASGSVSVRGINVCGTGQSTSAYVNVNASPPATAGPISGMTDVCAGTITTTYTTPVIAGATSYQWVLPPGATGSSPTNSISVTYPASATSGNITVRGINSCGNGNISSLGITVNNCAAGPAGAISGPTHVFTDSTDVSYSVNPVSNATAYVWTVPPGADIVAGLNTHSITVSFSSGAISGDIQVYGVNNCGNGLPSPPFYVTVNPLLPVNRVVSNVNILNGEEHCYDAIQTVSIAGNNSIFTVDNGGSAHVVAGERIMVNPLTRVYAGGYFHAWITTNGSFCSTVLSFLAPDTTGLKQGIVSSSDIVESSGNLHIRAYPNPTEDLLTIELTENPKFLPATIKVFGMHGEKFMEIRRIIDGKTVLTLEALDPGMYFLLVSSGNHQGVLKIIKQ